MNKKFFEELKEVLEKEYGGDIDDLVKDLQTSLLETKADSKKAVEIKDAIVTFQNITKTYNLKSERVEALQSVSFEIGRGEIVSIIGPSGSGKSTLLQLIGGLDKPTSGKMIINGEDISKLKERELSRFRNETVGFVFQMFYLQPYLNVTENVMMPLLIKGEPRKSAEVRALELVKAVGLEDRSYHLPKQLSGGQMQRVAIARALATNPAILLADEPTANLDRKTADEVLSLMHKLRDEFSTTIIIVTHDVAVANKSDRVIKILDGKII